MFNGSQGNQNNVLTAKTQSRSALVVLKWHVDGSQLQQLHSLCVVFVSCGQHELTRIILILVFVWRLLVAVSVSTRYHGSSIVYTSHR